MTDRAPDYAEPAIGWRACRVTTDGGRLLLRSAVYDEVWQPGRGLVARCLAGREHRAPARGCVCGLYAVRDPRRATRYLVGRDDPEDEHRVIGLVALWGRVVEAEHGWRAELAYPKRLLVPVRRTNGWEAPASRTLAALADYGVPVELLDEHEPARLAGALAA